MTYQNGHIFYNTNSTMRKKMNGDTCSPTRRAKLKAADGGIAVTAIGSDIMLNAANGNKFYCITIDIMNNFNTKGEYL